MDWLKLFKTGNQENDNLPVIGNFSVLSNSIFIPEPTKSLLWVTNEDTSKIETPHSIKISITLTDEGLKTTTDHGYNFYGEPSLIWTRLKVEKNTDIETKPMYYPSYSNLSPQHRYQYLNWLRDITQQTNLSYVFLYFYGLERHMLVGNYNEAVAEILRLLKYNDGRGTFGHYARTSLLVATLYRKRYDFLKENPYLVDSLFNEALIMRQYLDKNLTPKEIIELSSSVGFKNKRYIKLYPEKFEKILADRLSKFETKNGPLINYVPVNELKQDESLAFANMSLPPKIRSVPVPQLLSNKKFQSVVRNLLEETHEEIKISKK
jgi:hypothetical protein